MLTSKKHIKMKRFGLLLLAAVVGSALSISTLLFINSNSNKTVTIEHVSGAPVVGATYTFNKSGDIVPLEFTEIAKKVMPAVVHIKSTQVQNVKNYNYRNNPDPFRDFFQDDMFKRFFGPEFKFESPQPHQRGPRARVGSGSGVIVQPERLA